MFNEIEIYEDLNSNLRNIWVELEKDSFNHCFQSYSWFSYWLDFYKRNKKNFLLQVIVLKKDKKVFAIYPFIIINRLGFKILQWAGDSYADYKSPIYSKKINYSDDKENFIHDLKIIIKKIAKHDIVIFERQPSDILGLKNPFYYFLPNIQTSNSYSVKIGNDFFNYRNSLNKKFTSDSNRRFNLSKNKFLIDFIHSFDEIIYKENIDDLIMLKYQTLKNKKIFLEKKNHFYKKLYYLNCDTIQVYFSFIKFDEVKVSYNLGVKYKKYFYYLVPTFKQQEYKKFAPGRLLIFKLIEWCHNNNLSLFDFTIGEESYKKDFSNHTKKISFSMPYKNNLKGLIFFYLVYLKKIIYLILKNLFNKKY
jgi:CelD/BcsL family acetyltransferase involved in cellulose biosynthesis